MKPISIFSAIASGVAFWGIYRLAAYAAPIGRMNASELDLSDSISKSSQIIVNSVSLLYNSALFGLALSVLILISCLVPVLWHKLVILKITYLSSFIAVIAVAVLSIYSFAIYEFMFYSTNSWRTEYRGLEKTIEGMGHLEEAKQRIEESKLRLRKLNQDLNHIRK